jgi:hypothetical protein
MLRSWAAVKRAGGSNEASTSGALRGRFRLENTLHSIRLHWRGGAIHPVHDFLKGFGIGIEGRLMQQGVSGLFQGRRHHELRTVTADQFHRLVDQGRAVVTTTPSVR